MFCVPVQPPLLEDCKLFESLFEGEMAAQAKEEWEKAMTELAQEEPELLQHFQKLSEAAGKVGEVLIQHLRYCWCHVVLFLLPQRHLCFVCRQ